MIRIVLPFPSKWLNPNQRSRWALTKARKAARLHAGKETMAAVNGGMREARSCFAGKGDIHVEVIITPPDNRRRDRDNMMASLKSHFDGIADALGVDDNLFLPTFTFAPPQVPGRVDVTVRPILAGAAR